MKKGPSLCRHKVIILAFSTMTFVATASADDLVGQGEWESRSGSSMRGTWTATLERSGSTIAGTIALTGTPLFTGGEASGTIDGNSIVLGVLSEGDHEATFKGTLTNEQIVGEWDCITLGDQGSWSGTLESEE